MPARKRRYEEVQERDNAITRTTAPAGLEPTSLLYRVRNCWQFAALAQYIFFFGGAVKIDKDIDVDVGIHLLERIWSGYGVRYDAD